MNGRTVAHYRITAKLGHGTWAKCTTKLRREIAIKILPPVRGGRWAHNQKQSTWSCSRLMRPISAGSPLWCNCARRPGDAFLIAWGTSERKMYEGRVS